MVIGETGVGKTYLLNSFLNYLEGIQLEENERYYLFDEKILKKDLEKYYDYSFFGKVSIYNIEPNKLINKPIRLIDTQGFGDTRGYLYDKKIIENIKNIFQSPEIENINAICCVFKFYQTRFSFLSLFRNVFSLFNNEIKNNIVFIFTFSDNSSEIPCLNELKHTFAKMLDFDDFNKFPYFTFDSGAYFTNDKELVEKTYENNTKNFRNLLNYISSLNRVSLKS